MKRFFGILKINFILRIEFLLLFTQSNLYSPFIIKSKSNTCKNSKKIVKNFNVN